MEGPPQRGRICSEGSERPRGGVLGSGVPRSSEAGGPPPNNHVAEWPPAPLKEAGCLCVRVEPWLGAAAGDLKSCELQWSVRLAQPAKGWVIAAASFRSPGNCCTSLLPQQRQRLRIRSPRPQPAALGEDGSGAPQAPPHTLPPLPALVCPRSDPVPGQRPGPRAPEPCGAREPHAVGAPGRPGQVRALRAPGAGLHPHRERGPQPAPHPGTHQRRRYVGAMPPPAPQVCCPHPYPSDGGHLQLNFQNTPSPLSSAEENEAKLFSDHRVPLQPISARVSVYRLGVSLKGRMGQARTPQAAPGGVGTKLLRSPRFPGMAPSEGMFEGLGCPGSQPQKQIPLEDCLNSQPCFSTLQMSATQG